MTVNMKIKNDKKHNKITGYFTTIKGELVGFNAITTPSTMFNPDGVYSANILVDAAYGKEVAKAIKDLRTQQYKTYGSKSAQVQECKRCVPYVVVEKNDEGEVVKETPDAEGRYIIKATAKGQFKAKDGTIYKNTIKIFDSKGRPLKDIRLGEGSIVKLAVEVSGYAVGGKVGVSVTLKAVQVIKLVEYEAGGNAAAYGFEEEEGFDADDLEEKEESVEDEVDVEEDLGF